MKAISRKVRSGASAPTISPVSSFRVCSSPLSSGAATDLGLRASLIGQHTPPEILIHGLVTPADVDKLFSMYVWPSARLECSTPSNIN